MPNSRDEVQILWASLKISADDCAELQNDLTVEELEQVARFATPELRRRALVSRAFLRQSLAPRVGLRPKELRFGHGVRQKPFLVDNPDVHFNLSHSGEVAVCAISHFAVGVDIEEARENFEYSEIAGLHYVDSERAALDRERFYRIWTAKEAFLKGLGDGLYVELSDVEIVLGQDQKLRFGTRTRRSDEWRLFGFALPEGYQGAVAVKNLSATGIIVTKIEKL